MGPCSPALRTFLASTKTSGQLVQSATPRTVADPEFPGENELLYFVMVEMNIEDVKELRRITQLEMEGTLDSEGLKAFVEVP